ERDRQGDRRWIAFWLPLTVLWINLHAGFVAGIVLIGVYCVEQLLRGGRWVHLALTAAAMVLLAVVNPYGTHYYSYLWRGLAMSRPAIGEWRPLWQSFPSFNSVVFLLSLWLILYAARKTGLRGMPGIAIVCATAAEAALHQRMLPFYAVAWTCYVARYVSATPLRARWKGLSDGPPRPFQATWTLV